MIFSLAEEALKFTESFLEIVVLLQLDGDIFDVRQHLMDAHQGRVNSAHLLP